MGRCNKRETRSRVRRDKWMLRQCKYVCACICVKMPCVDGHAALLTVAGDNMQTWLEHDGRSIVWAYETLCLHNLYMHAEMVRGCRERKEEGREETMMKTFPKVCPHTAEKSLPTDILKQPPSLCLHWQKHFTQRRDLIKTLILSFDVLTNSSSIQCLTAPPFQIARQENSQNLKRWYQGQVLNTRQPQKLLI